MKKDKFKRLRLEVQTCEAVEKKECCALLFAGMEWEMPEQVRFSFDESFCRKASRMADGTLVLELEAKGIRSDSKNLRHLRAGKQAELLDYSYFKSKMPSMVITSLEAELFDCQRKNTVPFIVRKLEFAFGNGKKIDLADHISVFSLDKLAA